MNAEHIAKQLQKARKQADGSWLACCPAHNDRTPSLSLSDGDKGLIWHCHATCSQDDVRSALERATDMEPYVPHETEPRVLAFTPDYICPRTHIYRDKIGQPIYVIQRKHRHGGGKTFSQSHIDSTGAIIPGMNGISRVPFQLHHFASTDTIIICEGELGVEALNRAGFIATCNPGGAGNWQPELNQFFQGKSVIIIPDNDEPGRKHAAKVAEQLTGSATSIITADVCQGLREKDDIVQYLGRHTPNQLRRTLATYIKGPEAESLAAWLRKEMPPRDYLMGQVICTTSRWMVYAPTGLGKTLFSLNLSTAMAAGQNFLHWTGGRKSRVLYIDGEMPRETFKERMVQVAGLYGEDVTIFGLNRDSLQAEGKDIPPLNALPEIEDGVGAGIAWLEEQIAIFTPDVIVFDSIMCLLAGDMKDEVTWEPIKALMKSLTNRYIAQIWVHHTGHAEGRSYGSNTREWELDTVLRLDRPKDDSEGGFVLNFTKARLRTPDNIEQFNPVQCALNENGWSFEQHKPEGTRKGNERERYRPHIVTAYDNLAVGLKGQGLGDGRGHNGSPVTAVSKKAIRDWMISHSLIPAREDGSMSLDSTTKKQVQRAQDDLISAGKFAGDRDNIWRVSNAGQ